MIHATTLMRKSPRLDQMMPVKKFGFRFVENRFRPVVTGPDPVPSVDIKLDFESVRQRRKHVEVAGYR